MFAAPAIVGTHLEWVGSHRLLRSGAEGLILGRQGVSLFAYTWAPAFPEKIIRRPSWRCNEPANCYLGFVDNAWLYSYSPSPVDFGRIMSRISPVRPLPRHPFLNLSHRPAAALAPSLSCCSVYPIELSLFFRQWFKFAPLEPN